METSIRDDLERFYQEQYHSHSEIYTKENNTPKFENQKKLRADDNSKKVAELETQNITLKQRLREVESKYAENIQTTGLLERDLKRAIIECEKLKREKAYLSDLVEKLKDNQKEKLDEDMKSSKEKPNKHINSLIEKCEQLQEEVLLYQSRDQQSQIYKRKLEVVEDTLNRMTVEKDKRILSLEHKIKKLRHQRHMEHYHNGNSKNDVSQSKNKIRSKSPIQPIRSVSPLGRSHIGRSATPGIDDLSTKIIGLEHSQTEYRRKLRSFLQDSTIPKDEIEKLSKILKQNDEKLHETKRIQHQVLRSSMRQL